MDISSYYNAIDKNEDSYFTNYTEADKTIILNVKKEYDSLEPSEKEALSFLNILIFDSFLLSYVCNALNFFLEDEIVYDEAKHAFVAYDGTIDKDGSKKISGFIYGKNYEKLIDVILERNGIERKKKSQSLKFKSKLAQEVWELTHQEDTDEKINKDMDLGNLISSVAAKDQSLNMINIWDLTVYQLYDQFQRQQGNAIYDISAMSIATWGDEKGNFDSGAWYKNNFVT